MTDAERNVITSKLGYRCRSGGSIMDDADRYELRMRAKDDLERYRIVKREIEHFRQMIEAERERLYDLKAIQYDRDKVQNSFISCDDAMIKIADLRTAYGKRVIENEKLLVRLETQIYEWCEPLCSRVLRMAYLYGWSFERIAVDEHASYRTIMRAHRRGLLQYGEKLAHCVT